MNVSAEAEEALARVEPEVGEGHGKASAGAAAALRNALKEHGKLIDDKLENQAHAALAAAGYRLERIVPSAGNMAVIVLAILGLMALAGAELLLYPTAIGWDPTDEQAEKDRQREAWILSHRGHAVANGLPVLSCNRVGHEPSPLGAAGIRFWGSSHVLGPQGEFLALAGTDAPEILMAEVDMQRSEHVRRIWPFLRDRRIDAYGDLLKRYRD